MNLFKIQKTISESFLGILLGNSPYRIVSFTRIDEDSAHVMGRFWKKYENDLEEI